MRAGDYPAGVSLDAVANRATRVISHFSSARAFFSSVYMARVRAYTEFFSLFILAMNIYFVPCLNDNVGPPRGRAVPCEIVRFAL